MAESFILLRIRIRLHTRDWEADMLTSVTFTQRKFHLSLGDWRGFSCTHHNYCLCKQHQTRQAITLGGNSHSCELCFGSAPSQDLRSNVNHPQCFKAPGKICKSAFPPKLLPWGGGGDYSLDAPSQGTWTLVLSSWELFLRTMKMAPSARAWLSGTSVKSCQAD